LRKPDRLDEFAGDVFQGWKSDSGDRNLAREGKSMQTANEPSDHNRRPARRRYADTNEATASSTCVYFGCSAKAAPGHFQCADHLARMSRARKKSVHERRRAGLCVDCGKMPQFWGLRCIICRRCRLKDADALPPSAVRALRLFHDAERKLALEQFQAQARFEVRKLLAAGEIKKRQAKALRLHVGVDDGVWRSHAEVGRLMKISRERVRQLLHAYKPILTATGRGGEAKSQPQD
jgi:hypothetical protein